MSYNLGSRRGAKPQQLSVWIHIEECSLGPCLEGHLEGTDLRKGSGPLSAKALLRRGEPEPGSQRLNWQLFWYLHGLCPHLAQRVSTRRHLPPPPSSHPGGRHLAVTAVACGAAAQLCAAPALYLHRIS